ncbi:MAG TPA: hypothetical protein DEF34_08815 [Desulfotomaculum sp.]|nr:MAG: hypothetical protein JL56_05060 [Desulfotomaculum sp. BICA1-6]HBX23711.1 hypothetical protein [Desulfotomaculum sp.]
MEKKRYAELIEKKNAYLKEFLRLTVLQKEALAASNMERFNELMDAKQAVIEQVDLLDMELILQKNNSHFAPGANQKAELELDTQKYLQQIRVLDIEVNELMQQNLSDTIKSINELQVAKRTETAYRNNARVAHSYFVNKQR